jgi:hypothetical protein
MAQVFNKSFALASSGIASKLQRLRSGVTAGLRPQEQRAVEIVIRREL